MSRTCAPHVLLLPHPLSGHMLPLLDLAHHLSLRGLTITVHSTPENLPNLHPLISSSPTVHPLLLPLPVQSQPSNDFRDTMVAMGSLHAPILEWAKAHSAPPVLIVSDFFLGWTRRLAEELGVPRVVFSPSGALPQALNHCLWREMPEREGDPVSEFVKKGMLDNVASWGVIVNSFKGMDGMYVDHLRRDLGHDRVWAVGPLSVAGVRPERAGLGQDVKGWLDGCPVGSVVYVCFGSMKKLFAHQTVAAALEESGVRFLWALKAAPTASNGDSLPDGFEKRTAGRGVVMRGWVAQVEILRHDAVGVFLTHCGWNSILEGIAAGVSLLAWPMTADQFYNARLLVEELGVAVRVCEGGEESVPEVGELAEKVKEAVSEGGGEMGVRGRELGRKALEAVEVGGSSYGDLDGFVGEVVKLHCLT
ncbi:UDP-glycosyltransferase 89B1 [Acorus gramineus]|uniref:UDP-glycosyltransferase 89B1 n=1 Tax=Acorus gramineus TaxID=55184 RepID=A0AAV9BAK1_ACOGR|nr:UDP-glycosyltransferase 89B1 [Acorus gramineus]